MDIIEIINQIEEDKKRRNIFPCHATITEIKSRCLSMDKFELRNELNRLYHQQKITVGRTLNDQYIQINKQ